MRIENRVIIIGGGASGMTAAIVAARNGAKTTILEHMDRIGKKILATGNGRCNLTNLDQNPEKYHSTNPEYVKIILKKFDVKKTISFFSELGIYTKNRNGYLYPNSDQASSVLDVLRMELQYLKVEVICGIHVKKVWKKGVSFQIETSDGVYEADRVILAAGSKAAPATGSDGSGYALAEALGHTVIPPVPALVQLRGKGYYFKSLGGIRTDVRITLHVNGKPAVSEEGELQLTDYGISGIPVFQVSRYAARARAENKRVQAVLDFLPGFDRKNLGAFMKKRIDNSPYKSCEELFVGLLNKKLSIVIMKEAGIKGMQKSCLLSPAELDRLAESLKNFTVDIAETNSYENAQVCAGGVSCDELVEGTLESKLVRGLYMAGELVDVDGACGGYNLQWAWSSGYTAGLNAAVPCGSRHPVEALREPAGWKKDISFS